MTRNTTRKREGWTKRRITALLDRLDKQAETLGYVLEALVGVEQATDELIRALKADLEEPPAAVNVTVHVMGPNGQTLKPVLATDAQTVVDADPTRTGLVLVGCCSQARDGMGHSWYCPKVREEE